MVAISPAVAGHNPTRGAPDICAPPDIPKASTAITNPGSATGKKKPPRQIARGLFDSPMALRRCAQRGTTIPPAGQMHPLRCYRRVPGGGHRSLPAFSLSDPDNRLFRSTQSAGTSSSKHALWAWVGSPAQRMMSLHSFPFSLWRPTMSAQSSPRTWPFGFQHAFLGRHPYASHRPKGPRVGPVTRLLSTLS